MSGDMDQDSAVYDGCIMYCDWLCVVTEVSVFSLLLLNKIKLLIRLLIVGHKVQKVVNQ